MQIVLLEGVCHACHSFLLAAFALVGRGSAQRGIEGNIAGAIAPQRTRLNVAPALAVRARARTPPRLPPRQLVEAGLQLARGKLAAAFDLVAAFPPVRIGVLEYALRCGFGLPKVNFFFARGAIY
jgi:hypothetical protein